MHTSMYQHMAYPHNCHVMSSIDCHGNLVLAAVVWDIPPSLGTSEWPHQHPLVMTSRAMEAMAQSK